ncbi:aspartic peptidase domain-containing protein [Russula vinacea]|nr:aspartic peptidase domain-containing protein [Russula vinacea]
MLLVAILASFVVLATTIADSNGIHVSLHITGHKNGSFHGMNPFHLSRRDQKRWMNLVKGGRRSTSETTDVPLADYFCVVYSANVGVGDPPAYYNLMIDTGSSNTWLGANKAYNVTKTSVKTDHSFNITYDTGSVFGTEYEDTVTIAPGVDIRQSIGVASTSSGIVPFDGILGLGPNDLTLGTLFPDNTSVIPTVTDNLYGEEKSRRTLLPLHWEHHLFPRHEDISLQHVLGVDASFRYGNASGNNAPVTILDTTAGVIDTGTSLIGLGTDAYNRYVDVTGAVYDNNTDLLRITPAQYGNIQSLFFDIGGRQYELNANAQIWPRALNIDVGGDNSSIYLAVYNLGPEYSSGFGFVAGMPFLERYYSVFDTNHSRIGFATTKLTYAEIN